MKIELVTIDYWGTIAQNNQEWNELIDANLLKVLKNHSPTLSTDTARTALAEEKKYFTHQLTSVFQTPPLRARIRNVVQCASLPPKEAAIEEGANSIDMLLHTVPPKLVDGAEEFLHMIKAAGLKVALICNTGWFSGDAISRALSDRGLIRLMDELVFSDRIGSAKPSPMIFNAALASLASSADEALHIGDSFRKDVKGALGVGMAAIHLKVGASSDQQQHLTAMQYASAFSYSDVLSIMRARYALRDSGVEA